MIPKYKDIVELLKKGSTLEAQEKIMELREAVMESQEENHALKERVKELEAELAFKNSVTFKHPFYYEEGDNNPLCAKCWEVDHVAVHYPYPFNSAAGPKYTCPNCKHSIIIRS